jgi:hypothetical protein
MELTFNEYKTVEFHQEDNPCLKFTTGAYHVELNVSQMACLLMVSDHIDVLINDIIQEKEIDFTSHLGSGKYVTLNSKYHSVDIRKWIVIQGEEKPIPSAHGVCFLFEEWDIFRSFLSEVEALPGIKEQLKPCYLSHDHFIDTLACNECCPMNAQNTFYVK